MVQNIISNIINKNLYNNQPSLNIDSIFLYNINNEEILKFNKLTLDKNEEDFVYIINDNECLNEIEEKEKEEYIKSLQEEIARINKIMEYLVINININKINIPNYKIYDYSELSKNLRTKVKTKNHKFDIKLFLIKNKINKDEIKIIVKKFLNTTILDFNLNEYKLMLFFILSKIIDLYDFYHKNLLYSLEIIMELPLLIRDKEKDNSYKNLININKDIININDTKTIITFNHFNLIKNAFNKSENKITSKIELTKNKDIFEIIFK
jgi:hypothetical protein